MHPDHKNAGYVRLRTRKSLDQKRRELLNTWTYYRTIVLAIASRSAPLDNFYKD